MAASPYIVELRSIIGHRLLLLPGVAAVIHDERGRVLLLRTTRGSWSLPAGGIEPGETPREAIVREVLEETGLAVVSSRLLDVVGGMGFRTQYPNGDRVEYTVAVFACDVGGGASRPDGDEVSSLHWVEPERVPSLLELPYPPSLFVRPAS